MKDPQNIAIAVLLVTAAILGTMVLGLNLGEPRAYGASSSVKQGDYILSSGELTSSSELIHVIDIPARKMVTYFLNERTNAIDVVDGVDLNQGFQQP